jgi:hypothetical protein
MARRTIVVGDVHGCAAELHALFDRLAVVEGSDRIVFVGDLVARGPDTRGVLDMVRRTGAVVVRGNHEDRLLAWRQSILARARGEMSLPPDLGRLHLDVAQSLTDEDWALLEATPVTHLLEGHRTLVVHAGLVPGVAIEEQDPAMMMRIRSLGARGEARDHGGAVPWGARWIGPPHVVFGHAASLEPQIHPWATGIDTGCVYGGYLTAMVLEDGREPPAIAARRDVLVSVPARRRYFEGGMGVGGRSMIGQSSRMRGPGPHSAGRRSNAEHVDAPPQRRSAGGRGSG